MNMSFSQFIIQFIIPTAAGAATGVALATLDYVPMNDEQIIEFLLFALRQWKKMN